MKFNRVLRMWWTMYVTAASLVSAAFAEGLRPDPDVKISEWADRYRIVGKPSPKEGAWVTDFVPYTREIMDNFSPLCPVEMSVLMKAAQGAGTEILLNVLGCIMHRYPNSTMLVLPTHNTAKKFVRVRLDPMIDLCPVLRGVVARPRSRDLSNTSSLKEFSGTQLFIAGANASNDIRSFPAQYLLMDEVDGYKADLDQQGDTTELAIQRTAAFAGRKIGLVSTPTLEDISLISRWHKRGDQRLFYIPCPLCGKEQALVFGADRMKEGRLGGLRWPAKSPDKVRYQCEYCGDEFEEWRKIEPLRRGYWEPQAPGVGGGKIRSYQINALYYPYGWPGNSWVNLASAWESDHKDPVKRKTFWNLKLGLPYKDPSEAKADADTLLHRCETYGPTLPSGVAVLTAGIDIQGNRIEAELVGWGLDEESWNIEYRVFPGNPSDVRNPVWAELDDWLNGEWLSELGVPLTIRGACVDAGYQAETVRKFCSERRNRRIWATIGRPGHGRAVWPTKLRKQTGALVPSVPIGVDTIKEVIYARLKIENPGPGFCHFPIGRDREYFEMLTAEIRVPDYSGPVPKYEWRKKTAGARNEALDNRGTAYAGLQALGMTTALRLNREVEKLQVLAEARACNVAPVRSGLVFTPAAPSVVSAADPWL
jgi:phage terminase large subunit GpA-like protein